MPSSRQTVHFSNQIGHNDALLLSKLYRQMSRTDGPGDLLTYMHEDPEQLHCLTQPPRGEPNCREETRRESPASIASL